jgi:hypothetical protein
MAMISYEMNIRLLPVLRDDDCDVQLLNVSAREWRVLDAPLKLWAPKYRNSAQGTAK